MVRPRDRLSSTASCLGRQRSSGERCRPGCASLGRLSAGVQCQGLPSDCLCMLCGSARFAVPHAITNAQLLTCCFEKSIHGKDLSVQAERCRMILRREELVPRAIAEEDSAAAGSPEVADRVAAVELRGNFMFDPVRNPLRCLPVRIARLANECS